MSPSSRKQDRIRVPSGTTSMRVLLISDTHGMLDTRILALGEQCGLILHAGDIGGTGVIHALREMNRPWFAVRGNNDLPGRWSDAWSEPLPETLWLELPGGSIAILHGHQHNPVSARHTLIRSCFAEARVVVYGHSHRLVCDLDPLPWVLNPGAAGRVRTYGGPSCMLLHIHGERWHVEPIRFSPLTLS